MILFVFNFLLSQVITLNAKSAMVEVNINSLFIQRASKSNFMTIIYGKYAL